MTEAKYDVALSFLVEDIALARKLHEHLSENLTVFFFERKQEEIAGREGLEKFREPFLTARVSVVLYRSSYGEANWTGVERTAIQDACLKQGYRNLLVVALEERPAMPSWIPETHIYFSITTFSFEQLVGTIKARVLERGGEIAPMTITQRAEQHQRRIKYEKARQELLGRIDNFPLMRSEVAALFESIKTQSEEVKASRLKIECEFDANECVLQLYNHSLVITWRYSGSQSLSGEQLVVKYCRGFVPLPLTIRSMWGSGEPPPSVRTETYKLDLAVTHEICWRGIDGTERSKSELAQKFLFDLFNFAETAHRH